MIGMFYYILKSSKNTNHCLTFLSDIMKENPNTLAISTNIHLKNFIVITNPLDAKLFF